MAKVSKPVVAPLYPSRFGSHSSMIDVEATKEWNDKNPKPVSKMIECPTTLENFLEDMFTQCYVEMVVCKDEFGSYETEKWRIDNNMVDPNRCANSRVKFG